MISRNACPSVWFAVCLASAAAIGACSQDQPSQTESSEASAAAGQTGQAGAIAGEAGAAGRAAQPHGGSAAGSGGQAMATTTGASGMMSTTAGMGGEPSTTSQAGSGMQPTGAAGMQAGSGGTQAGTGGMPAQAGAGGAGGSGGATAAEPEAGAGATQSACAAWPAAMGQRQVGSPIRVSGSFDGKLQRFSGVGALGSGSQDEGQDPLFDLAEGATLENVIVGAPAADGIHCQGSCTLRNVWWEDVGEDAATLKGNSPNQVMSIECGGARKASDKVFQHNGPGTMRIRDFIVEDFGKLYRSCGNCRTQHERHVEMSGIEASHGKVLAGINTNYDDTASFEDITVHDPAMKMDICDRYTGNNNGSEPSKSGSGADGQHCMYDPSDIRWVP